MLDCSEFSVDVDGQSLKCLLAEPDRLSKRPALLLNFASDRATTLLEDPYDITPRMFVGAGHRAASIDLPCHGDRAVPGRPQGIAGFCAEWVSGRDVFARFVDDGHAVLDVLIQRGLAEPGRIFVAGTSRGGYCALRLMAEDERIEAAAAFAPVTDWRARAEFADVTDRPDLAELALTGFADALAGRAVWAAIGNRDARVGTECCLRFAEAVVRAEAEKECAASRLALHVVPAPGHSLSDDWRRSGAKYLLATASAQRTGEQRLSADRGGAAADL